jgi:hypothetical protein
LPTPLRGRDKEVACLGEQLGRLRAGLAAIWLIEGGAGLGKSRMLEEVISASRAAGFAVGHGVAEPGDAAVQLAVLMDALFGGSAAPLERSSLGESHASPAGRAGTWPGSAVVSAASASAAAWRLSAAQHTGGRR